MSYFETLTLVVAWISAVVSVIALIRTRKTEAKQLELQETQAKLAAFQHKVLAAEQDASRRADLRVELVRSGRDAYFVFSNVGASPGKNVSFGIFTLGLRKTPLMDPEQFNRLFPIAEFLPNASHKLRAFLALDTPAVLEGEYSWQDIDGRHQTRKCTIPL